MDAFTTMPGQHYAVTLDEFADRVGCHFTTASRLRGGHRLPGRELLGRIVEAYNLDDKEALTAFTSGKEAFGQLLRDRIFTDYELPFTPDPIETDDNHGHPHAA